MIENENLVPNGTENVEQTTEQTPAKTYTQAEVDEIVGKRIARNTAKITKQYERKYGQLENVLKAGTGKESVEEMTDTFTKFYEGKGIKINKDPEFSQRDIETLAHKDADEIIHSGYDDVVEELDRLNDVGVANMTAREKAMFTKLAEYQKHTETSRQLAEIGVTEDVYNSQEFKDFARQFTSSTPIEKVYEIFSKTQPKKQIKPMGSMKNSNSGDNGVKDFYTFEEAKQFTKEDFDKNPALFKAVEGSMSKW